MTMRLDIVTNDAGELVRREHARDLGSGVVIAIYRLAKLAQLHNLTNQAFIQQLDQTYQIIGDYCLRSGTNVNVLFAHRAIFVAGQLLKGSRAVYEMASELGDIFEWLGGSELTIMRDVTREELLSFAEQISSSLRSERGTFQSTSNKVRLRPVNDAARLRGLEIEDLSQDQRTVRAYASAVVIMRRFFEDLGQSKYILPRRIKRVAQSLVDLSEHATAAFLGVTEARNANHDEAGRAVNAAILSVLMARDVTQDRVILAQIAMAAMMFDVARPRALALSNMGGGAMPAMVMSLSEDQEDRLAAGAAAVLTALGRVNEPSIRRTVLAFEALWLRRQQWLGVVYRGVRPATIHARVIMIARRYNDLLTPEPGLPPPTPDFAVATLSEELKDPQDKTVLRMLVSSLGLIPLGTVVQLSTGEVAEVTRGAVSVGDKPSVRVVMDANGAVVSGAPEMDLAGRTDRTIVRVLSVDGWKKGVERRDGLQDGPPPPSGPRPADSFAPAAPIAPTAPIPPPMVSAAPFAMAPTAPAPPPIVPPAPITAPLPQSARSRSREVSPPSSMDAPSTDSGSSVSGVASTSLPSLGSSPSAVAEAMGRMINDALRPPVATGTVPPRAERTVMHASPEMEGREPTARGNLAATPLAHVLVYMLDHGLTGSVVFYEQTGTRHVVYFVRGVPAKVLLGYDVAPLGEVLVRAGALDGSQLDAYVDGARRLGVVFGEYLVGHDLVARETLSWALETQMLEKIASLANLPPETTYDYFRDTNLLEQWGGEALRLGGALNPILAAVRAWHDRARVRATLNRVGKHPLVFHDDADIGALMLLTEEEAVIETIHAEAMTLSQLFRRGIADEEVTSSVIYTLAVTRQFAFKGQKRGPMAPRGASSISEFAPEPIIDGIDRNSLAPVAPLAPPSPRPPRQSPSQRVPMSSRAPASPQVSDSARARAAAPQSVAPSRPAPHSLRPIQPAAVPRAKAPAIRPMPGRPSSAPSVPPAPQVRSRAPGAPLSERVPSAAPSPAVKQPVRNVPPRPMPKLPSQVASQSRMPAHVAPSPRAPIVAPAPQSRPKVAPPRAHEIEIDEDAIEIAGDDDNIEMDEAEAALEAMTSFRLAEAALQRNDTASAERLAQKAVDADSSQPEYRVLHAWILSLRSTDAASIDDAIALMTEVLEEDPTNERAFLYRGKLHKRTGDNAAALEDFENLLSNNPHHREAQAEAKLLRAKR